MCESSPVVSSSGATFASSRSATRVISRPFQKLQCGKIVVCNPIAGQPVQLAKHLSRAAQRDRLQVCDSHKSVSGFPVSLVAQMLEAPKRCRSADSPSGNCSTTSTKGGPSGGQRSLSCTSVVSTCGGFSEAAAFSRIQLFPSRIAQNITRFVGNTRLPAAPRYSAGDGARTRRAFLSIRNSTGQLPASSPSSSTGTSCSLVRRRCCV